MKDLIIVFLFLFQINIALSQQGQWTWLKGDSLPNQAATYGVQGVAASANVPIAVYEPVEWTDLNGNFWMFGGTISISGGISADLWKYDPLTNKWTWMKGPPAGTYGFQGNFGIQGVPSPLNLPPGSTLGVASWVDQNGNLWMLGGQTSDLWKYNISTNEWTWMKGNGGWAGVYGIKNVENPANIPPTRVECVGAWVDNQNNLWFFGGLDNLVMRTYNDMWKFDISTNNWTWMKGDSITNQPGVINSIGIEDSLNIPCSRYIHTRWKDHAGNFWMFGGANAAGMLSDLWKFNPLTNNWTYLSGTNSFYNKPSNHGVQCVVDSSNWPSPRFEARSAWTDINGDLWMFGGSTILVQSAENDLWKYCILSNKWIWINGSSISNAVGHWGTQGVAAPSNVPSARWGSIGWTDNNNHLFLFGGSDSTWNIFRNDLWKFTIDTSCSPCSLSQLPIAQFNFTDSVFCGGVCVNFINHSINANHYKWYFPGGSPANDTSANPMNICYNVPGTYNVTLIATNSFGSDTLFMNNAVTLSPPNNNIPITQNGDTLFSVPGYASYQWYLDSTLLTGETNYFHVAGQNGTYSVQIVDSNGCEIAGTLTNVIAMTSDFSDLKENIQVEYSEVGITVTIVSECNSKTTINVFDEIGKEIHRRDFEVLSGKNNYQFPEVKLSQGVYFIVIANSTSSLVKKLFVR